MTSPSIGLGCMRLSTATDRDDERSIAVIHAALDAGATFLDTADAYCLDESETGHNEKLIARALNGWSGDPSRIVVATKGGLRRPKGAWINDARAKSLRDACDASRRALGVDTIDLYQLHAVDPKTPLETSVRALASLQRDGAIRDIGLCNVTVGQIERAREIVDIAAVQISLSPFDDENLRNGVAEYCRDNAIRLIAYRPLGGDRASRLGKDAVVASIASKHDATAQEVILAWLAGFNDVVPIPGATQVQTAESIARALAIAAALDADDRDALDARFTGRLLRVPRDQRRPSPTAEGDVVIVMGMPGAGKTTAARDLEALGYQRLNRDALGGSLSDLIPRLEAALAERQRSVVLDNTYGSRSARNEVIECAWRHGVPVRCIWLSTELPEAQINAINRMLDAHGSLPSPEEIRAHAKKDPRYLGPDALFRYEKTIEPPIEDEGFTTVERCAFSRAPTGHSTARALFFDFDDLFLHGTAALADSTQLELNAVHRDVIEHHTRDGWLLFVHAWRPEVAKKEFTTAHVDATFLRARELLDSDVDVTFACCPHDAGPPICWCRKPLPGSTLDFARSRSVDLGRSLIVPASAADRTMAARLGLPIINE